MIVYREHLFKIICFKILFTQRVGCLFSPNTRFPSARSAGPRRRGTIPHARADTTDTRPGTGNLNSTQFTLFSKAW